MSAQHPNLQRMSLPSGEEILYELNRDAFSREGTALAFQRHLKDITRFEDSLFIVIGSDSGLLPAWLNQQGIGKGTRILCLEPDWVIPQLPEQAQPYLEHDTIRITSASQWQSLHEDFRFTDYAVLRRIHVVQSFAASDDYLGIYQSLHFNAQTLVTDLQWQLLYSLGGELFILRQLENLADFSQPAEQLRSRGKGRKALILAGGPSLDTAIGQIREQRDQLFLIAVSRIARKLIQENITPDIIVSIDPNKVSFEVSREMLRFNPAPLFACAHHCMPQLVGQWHGPLIYMGNRVPWDSELNVPNIDIAGPTVSNTAINLALAMGFDEIGLVGLDLCFSAEGQTHASGSIEHDSGPLLSHQGKPVETYSGEMADAPEDFYLGIQSVGQQAQAAETQNSRLVSLSWHGAKIPHIDYQPLNEFIDSCAQQAPIDLHIAKDKKVQQHYLKEALTAVQTARKDLYQIIKLTEKALDYNARLFGRTGQAADFKFKHRMDKIERQLNNKVSRFSRLVRIFSARAFLQLVRPGGDQEAWTDEEIENWGNGYYQTYHDSANKLLGIIDLAEKRISNRQGELRNAPLEKLAEAWLEQDTPGRYRVWQSVHPEASNDQIVDRLKSAFETQLTEQKLSVKDRAKKQRQLDGVRKKIHQLVAHESFDALRELNQQLAERKDIQAQLLYALSNAKLAEQKTDNEQAQAQYQFIIDTIAQKPDLADQKDDIRDVLQDALKGMVAYSLAQHDAQSALLGLGVLSDLSPAYLPQYADLLHLQGDSLAAIDAYSNYIEHAPKDLGAFIRLGKIFQTIGADESAIMAYDHVLIIQPNNALALDLRQQAQTTMKTRKKQP